MEPLYNNVLSTREFTQVLAKKRGEKQGRTDRLIRAFMFYAFGNDFKFPLACRAFHPFRSLQHSAHHVPRFTLV